MSRETYLDQVAKLVTEKSRGLSPRECAKKGLPLPPAELILLENALTIAEGRIAELEAAYNRACVYIAENRDCPYDEFDVEPEGDCEHLCPDKKNTTICWKWYFVGKNDLPPIPGKESR